MLHWNPSVIKYLTPWFAPWLHPPVLWSRAKVWRLKPVHLSTTNVRYRLLPGFARKGRQLFSLAGTCRFVWNRFLARNQEAYQLHQENPEHQAKPSVHFFSLCKKEFRELHNSGEFPLTEGVFLCMLPEPRFKTRGSRTTLGLPIPDGV